MQQHEFLNIQVDHVSSDASVADLFTKSLMKIHVCETCEGALACFIYQNYKFVRHQGESTHMSLTSVVFGALYSFSFDHAFYFHPRGFCFAGKVLARQHVMHRVTLGTRHKGEC